METRECTRELSSQSMRDQQWRLHVSHSLWSFPNDDIESEQGEWQIEDGGAVESQFQVLGRVKIRVILATRGSRNVIVWPHEKWVNGRRIRREKEWNWCGKEKKSHRSEDNVISTGRKYFLERGEEINDRWKDHSSYSLTKIQQQTKCFLHTYFLSKMIEMVPQLYVCIIAKENGKIISNIIQIPRKRKTSSEREEESDDEFQK